MSYDAGHQPPMYRQPSYPPQTPTAHGTPYDYGSSYGPSHHEMAQYGIPIAASGKRKAQRASQVSLATTLKKQDWPPRPQPSLT
jgi:hypothetical protein